MTAPPAAASDPRPPRRDRLLLFVLGLLVSTGFLASLLTATEGHFVPQVVDLYLTCQYARGFAEGHPFQYNPGDPPSTGSTSLLHTLLLALGHAAGARGEGLVAFAVATGIVFFLLSVHLAHRVGMILVGTEGGLLAGALVALGGPVVWGYLYGADIALFMLLALALLASMLREWPEGRVSGTVAVASLIAVARPEGLPIAVLIAAAWFLGPGRRAAGRHRYLILLPVLLGLGILVLYRVLTGAWMGTSIADKSLFANYGLRESLAVLAEYHVDLVRGVLLGLYPSQTPVGFGRGWAPFYLPPLALVLVVLAVVRASPAHRPPLLLWLGTVAAVSALFSPNVYLGAHFNRYILWAFPGLSVLAAAGLAHVADLARGGDPPQGRLAFRIGAALCVGLGLLTTLRFALIYGDLGGEVYRRDVSAARWITANLPPGVSMANLATSVEYLTGHRNLNLHGVTSPEFSGNRMAEREAGVFEALGRLDESRRPPYLITTASAQERYPTMQQLVSGAPLFRTQSLADDILIFRTRYDLVGNNSRPLLPGTAASVRGLQEVDRLNVVDARDEQAHRYSFRSSLDGWPLSGAVRIASYPGEAGVPGVTLADAGRAILGSEAFRVRTEAGKDLLVVMRTAPAATGSVLRASGFTPASIGFPEAGITIRANGRVSGRLSVRPREGWDEVVIRVTANLIGPGHTDLELSGRYASFFYWFYQ